MSSGGRSLVYNNLERAISTDLNRAQSFQQRSISEALFRLFAVKQGGDIDPSLSFLPAPDGLPTSMEIFGGLLVKPQTGSFEIQIDPGVACFLHSDGSTDSSNYKLVREVTGVGAGVLVITPNVSGSIRIDVIECRVNPVPTTVTDSRDIYNTITELFTPAVVTKESEDRFEFRVRAGVGGAGYPAAVVGWTQLCVASVPNAAASNNDITFWDVRPLAEDRVHALRNEAPGFSTPYLDSLEASGVRVSATSFLITGWFRAQINGRILGGKFRRGNTGTGVDNSEIDIASGGTNQSTAITEALTGNVFVYVCVPKGLPRWSMYAAHPSARLPSRGLKGMLVVSYQEPDVFGAPLAPIAIPTAAGLGGTVLTEEAVCVAVMIPSSGTTWNHFFAAHKKIVFGDLSATLDATTAGVGNARWDYPTTLLPANVNSALIQIEVLGATIGATTTTVIDHRFISYANVAETGPYAGPRVTGGLLANSSGAPVTLGATYRVTDWIPFSFPYPASVVTRRLRWQVGDSPIHGVGITAYSATLANYQAWVQGIEL